jgi:ribokinase
VDGGAGGVSAFVAAMGLLNVDIIYSGMPRIPAEGEEVFSTGFDLQLGGGPAATLINLRHLGVPSRLGVFLGDDMWSAFARGVLDHSGLRYENLYTDGGCALTVTSIISTRRDRTFVSHRPRDMESSVPAARFYDLYSGCSVAYVPLGFDDVCRRLKREGAIIVLDSMWREDLSLEMYQEAFSYVDFFTPNEKEACKITGARNALEAIRILADRVAHPIVKLGSNGCLFCDGGSVFHAPGIEEFVSVDTTGAGDAFLSGLIYGLFKGNSLERCVRLGNIIGGKCVTGIGCLTEHFDEESLMAWEKRGLPARTSARKVCTR